MKYEMKSHTVFSLICGDHSETLLLHSIFFINLIYLKAFNLVQGDYFSSFSQ